jgi:hypothetical protein
MGRYIKQPHLRSAFGARRVILIAACFIVFIFLMMYAEFKRGDQPRSAIPHTVPKAGEGALKFDSPGAAIAPKLGNATLRYVEIVTHMDWRYQGEQDINKYT